MKKAILIFTLIALGGCATSGESAKPGEFGANMTTGGAILGGIGGAFAGSQFGKGKGQLAATALGTALGAFAGYKIGESLDAADQAHAATASQRAFETAPSGQAVSWRNPDSGHGGSFTPTRTSYNGGQPCRDFETTVSIDGRTETATGTACRQADGSWKIVR